MQTARETHRRRAAQLERLGNETFDVLILGGGISGAAAAHELVERGYRTALIDNRDFASGTSQESSQLVWGGIKYLEQGHVKLVVGLCRDRNALVRRYPERVRPRQFLYPHFEHDPHSLFTILLGSYLYWAIGRGYGRLPQRGSTQKIERLIPQIRSGSFRNGLEYSEATMAQSDARLTLDILFDAVDAGLAVGNHLETIDRRWNDDRRVHKIAVKDRFGDAAFDISARWLVNTAGVWIDPVNEKLGLETPHRLMFSKGIHLVLPRLESHDRALTCLSRDGRYFFVVPWGQATLVGTTDTPHEAPPSRVRAEAEDIQYLHRECEDKFRLQVDDEMLLNTKAGLRPLLRPKHPEAQDFLALSREHKVWSDRRAAITGLWGGKYTSCFSMAREIADDIEIEPSGTKKRIGQHAPARNATDIEWLGESKASEALARAFEEEMVMTLEDFLRRRTNIALKVANRGWGKRREHAGRLRKLAAQLSETTGRALDDLLDEYVKATRVASKG